MAYSLKGQAKHNTRGWDLTLAIEEAVTYHVNQYQLTDADNPESGVLSVSNDPAIAFALVPAYNHTIFHV
jgi:hypothetical protein